MAISTPSHPVPPTPVHDFGRLLVGFVIVAVGVLFLLDAAGSVDAGAVMGDWWPLVIVAAGVLTLFERPPALLRAGVLTGIGVVVLLFTTGVLEESAWKYVWPMAIVLAGVAVLLRWNGRRVQTVEDGDDVIRATAAFGGAELSSSDQAFRGAWLTAVFGGATLDLREARPAPGGASVNATAVFGGVDVLVPRGWRITVKTVPIFGGVDDKTDRTVLPAADAPELVVDAVCIFGGVGIKHEK